MGLPTVFSVSQFPRATPQRIEAARKNVREVLDENLDRSVEPWRDVETGEELELVRGWFTSLLPRSPVQSRSRSRMGTSWACAQRGTSIRLRASTSATWVEVRHESPRPDGSARWPASPLVRKE